MVADLDRANSCTHRFDDTGALVAADRGVIKRHVAGAVVLLGVTQPGGMNPNEHLGLARWIELDLLDRPAVGGTGGVLGANDPSAASAIPIRPGGQPPMRQKRAATLR